MRINELNVPIQPDTYEASMFLKQAIRAGKYAIKIHDLLSNDQEMESWVAKKIDLASGYITSVAHYLEGQTYSEDAGEGHMSRSQLYATAKYALQIATIVRPGDDIEGWVQTKMNQAVDMLDAVYHYEDYQMLNPYREEIGDLHQKHAEIVKKNIDEILATETPVDDIETKPGMLNILKKRVHQFEKDYAKENKKTDEAGSRLPSSMVKTKSKLDSMNPEEIRAFFKKREDFAAQHRGGKIAPGYSAKELAQRQEFSYGREFAKRNPYSKHFEDAQTNVESYHPGEGSAEELAKEIWNNTPAYHDEYKDWQEYMNSEDFEADSDKLRSKFESTQKPYVSQGPDGMWHVLDKNGRAVFSSSNYDAAQDYFKKNFDNLKETELDEGLKDWLQRMAAAGIIVGSVAGIGSINNAMDNSVPVIQAMNRAMDAANQKGDRQMIQNIKQDIETAKISLNSGQSLNTVKNMQDRYAKFMPSDYKKENKSFKDRIMGKIMSPIKDYNKQNNRPKDTEQDKMVTKQPANPADPADVSEEKQKGLDGKACWKGYRRMGTKMKGGKRVDNCVKYESRLAEKLANKLK